MRWEPSNSISYHSRSCQIYNKFHFIRNYRTEDHHILITLSSSTSPDFHYYYNCPRNNTISSSASPPFHITLKDTLNWTELMSSSPTVRPSVHLSMYIISPIQLHSRYLHVQYRRGIIVYRRSNWISLANMSNVIDQLCTGVSPPHEIATYTIYNPHSIHPRNSCPPIPK